MAQRMLVRRTSVIGMGEAFRSAWEAGKNKSDLPEWIPCTVLDYVGGNGAVVRLDTGRVKEVRLDDLRDTPAWPKWD